ncbi:cleavage stimulating factor 64 [Andrographis paniculata]|uniref:cleavage stimulating factor 64 n=1 Tax=Andrographis paniculata TaxID=175694 RepID=UPI0021E78723|nr:cleavage stimulating factor 64 [Andrographis paniculata]
MAGKQVASDGVPSSLAGMSKNQLYDIMSQMKALIEQNKEQARQILIQNPNLTKALFQAQIMLGMVQPPKAPPVISAAASQNPQPSAASTQQPKIHAPSSFPGQSAQNQLKAPQPNQAMSSNSQSQHTIPPNAQTPAVPSHPLQQPPMQQQPKAHHGPPSTPQSSSQVPNLTQLPQHIPSQPAPLHQLPVPSLPPQQQQSMQNTSSQYMPLQQQPQLQPPLPPQPRPPIQGFPHQLMGQNLGFQHPGGQQLHPSQHMFHPGTKPPPTMGPSFPQVPNQSLPQSHYQAGGSQVGMDFNQVGSSKQPERGSNRPPNLPDNTMGQLPGPPFSQAGPSNQPPRQPPLTPEMEKALLQQVMSLTPEQINMLPVEQRNQVLQLQQMLRQ